MNDGIVFGLFKVLGTLQIRNGNCLLNAKHDTVADQRVSTDVYRKN